MNVRYVPFKLKTDTDNATAIDSFPFELEIVPGEERGQESIHLAELRVQSILSRQDENDPSAYTILPIYTK